jgi:hypothetical protein
MDPIIYGFYFLFHECTSTYYSLLLCMDDSRASHDVLKLLLYVYYFFILNLCCVFSFVIQFCPASISGQL